jgi:N4-(beta-N-acetylglucosaminyl)-L-asparaginase
MNPQNRRDFLLSAAAGVAAAAAFPLRAESAAGSGAVVVSTWPFGKAANDQAFATMTSGGSGLDGIEKGINVTEADPNNAYVGLAGIPAADGVVSLDACIMTGPRHQAGSVAGLIGYKHPISVARRVMETTPHVMLVGAGAAEFAHKNGFEPGPKVSPKQKALWEKWKKEHASGQKTHDTIAMVLLAPDGHVYGGCSTSGLSYKLPGRVGDSPIIGSGLYVDDEVGAAGATGVGENVLRYCGSFQVVEMMRQGMHPMDACKEVIKRIAKLDPKGDDIQISFIAVDKQGRYGGAGSGPGFEFAVTTKEFSKVLPGGAGPGKHV